GPGDGEHPVGWSARAATGGAPTYAQAHADRVTGLVLAAVTTTSRAEVDWITESVGRIFPREWERFVAALAWCDWEDVHVSLDPAWQPSPRYRDPAFHAQFATQVVWMWAHSAFLGDRGILDGLAAIAHLPAVLIHGRLDVSGPLVTAWDVHRGLPRSELVMIEHEGHGGTSMTEAVDDAYTRLAG